MPIKINGATSGSTTITAPDSGGDESIELSTALASKVDYALPVNAQTGTTYTFVAADAEKLTTASNGSAVTLTIPPQSSVTWSDNTVLRVVNYGAGAVTIDGGSGVTVTNTSSTIAQYGAAVAIRTGSDAWTVVPFGGGDIPAAEVSSPSATGQYTDTGITYDYYTFTSSGTLTVDTAGLADILVVGGGGGGGNTNGGGGGGGGYIEHTNVYLTATTYTVVVGAGGASTSGASVQGGIGTASALDNLAVPGGGGGGSGTTKAGLGGGSGGGAASDGTRGSGVYFQSFSPPDYGANDGGLGGGAALAGGGGGGANAVGGNASSINGGNGGAGISSSITGSSIGRSGGGGGRGTGTQGTGADGGGDAGTSGTNGTANTGGGGGGCAGGNSSGAGGSGVVIIRVAA